MKRRALLTSSLGLLLFPATSNAHRRGDGYKTIPYVPQDTDPYFSPGKNLLAHRSYIDPSIWPVVKKINESGWVWTAESCQGHKNGWSEVPMLRLVCRSSDINDLLQIIYKTAAQGRELPKTANGTKLTIERHRPAPRGWSEFRLYADSLAFFSLLATRL